jgi:hypothetical protein
MTARENCLLAYQHKTPGHIPCFFTDITMIQACPDMERYTGITTGKDYWGCEWVYENNIHACIPVQNKYLFTDIAEWKEKLHFPDLDAIDWEKQADIDAHTDFFGFVTGNGIKPNQDGSSCYDNGKAVVVMVLNGMFERMHACMGFENALMALAEDPDSCKEYFHAMADWKIAYFRKIAKYYKADIINAHDDYGANDRMFMSPQTWRVLIKPELKRMVDACHEAGLIYQHHSCGFIEPIIGDLVEIGVDALDPLQACNTNVAMLKKQYGKDLTFCGGFDNMHVLDIQGVSPDAVKAEYRRVIDSLAPGGSYVIYPITGTFDFVPAFLEEHFQYGMGFYANQG